MARDGFGRLAGIYEGLEHLAYGRLLMRSRLALLDGLAHAEHVLILGEGDGRFLVKLLQINPHGSVTVLDSSAGMLGRAEARVRKKLPKSRSRVAFKHADALTETFSPNTYDALVTCFFLDVFPAELLERLVPKLGQALTPGGHWLLADFAAPHTLEQPLPRFYSQIMVPPMYAFFRAQTVLPARTLIPPQLFLRAAGLRLEHTRAFRGGFVYAQTWRKPNQRLTP